MNRLWSISCVAFGCVPGIVMAQGHPAIPASTPADVGQLAEVIVTANKRDQNINRVGMSVQAISGSQLSERRITSLQDIAAAVPGLSFAESSNETPIFTLRGVGFNESSLGVYPAVSVYVDQIPLPFPVMTEHSDFDLQRIEVLKGPQGTLYGENSTGGAINFIAASPTSTFEGGGNLTFGRFNETDENAFLSGPITDTLRARIAVTSHHMDNWQYSVTRPNDTNGHQSYIAARGLLDWRPASSLRVSLNLNGWNDTSQPQAWQMIGIRTQYPQYEPARYPNPVFSPNDPRAADWTVDFLDPALGVVNPATGAVQPGTAQLDDIAPFGQRSFEQAALHVNIDLSKDLTVTSLTSYDNYRQRESLDNDGSNYVIENFPALDGYIHSFYQEIRVANSNQNRFRWIFGSNFEHSITFEFQNNRYQHTAYNPQNLYINASLINNEQHFRNYAFFNHSEFNLTKKLTLTGGVRYTNTRDKANICSFTIPGGNVDKLFNVLGGLLGTVPFTPIGPSNCYTLNQNFVPGEPYANTLAQSNVSWQGGVNYQVLPETMVYATVSRGYKAGSFPSLAAALYRALSPVTQESVTAYETGIKSQTLDNRLTIDGAVFYYDYLNKQVRGKLSDPIFGALEAEVNVPKSRIYGAELEAAAEPMNGLVISAGITYLQSKIENFTGVNVLGQSNWNAAGDPLPFTPRWSGSANFDYRILTGHGIPFVGASVHVTSEQDAQISAQRLNYFSTPNTVLRPGVLCVYCVAGYATTDVRMGYQSESGKWKVTLWGKNIFNKYYWTDVIAAYDDTARIAGMPATYGITIGYHID